MTDTRRLTDEERAEIARRYGVASIPAEVQVLPERTFSEDPMVGLHWRDGAGKASRHYQRQMRFKRLKEREQAALQPQTTIEARAEAAAIERQRKGDDEVRRQRRALTAPKERKAPPPDRDVAPPSGKRRAYPERDRRIVEMTAAGMTAKQIAAEVGMGVISIHRARRRLGCMRGKDWAASKPGNPAPKAASRADVAQPAPPAHRPSETPAGRPDRAQAPIAASTAPVAPPLAPAPPRAAPERVSEPAPTTARLVEPQHEPTPEPEDRGDDAPAIGDGLSVEQETRRRTIWALHAAGNSVAEITRQTRLPKSTVHSEVFERKRALRAGGRRG